MTTELADTDHQSGIPMTLEVLRKEIYVPTLETGPNVRSTHPRVVLVLKRDGYKAELEEKVLHEDQNVPNLPRSGGLNPLKPVPGLLL
jgi:hypothetical protein